MPDLRRKMSHFVGNIALTFVLSKRSQERPSMNFQKMKAENRRKPDPIHTFLHYYKTFDETFTVLEGVLGTLLGKEILR